MNELNTVTLEELVQECHLQFIASTGRSIPISKFLIESMMLYIGEATNGGGRSIRGVRRFPRPVESSLAPAEPFFRDLLHKISEESKLSWTVGEPLRGLDLTGQEFEDYAALVADWNAVRPEYRKFGESK